MLRRQLSESLGLLLVKNMLTPPKISVVTPTYNRHNWLVSCIEQTKNQDVDHRYEHIVVSDGQDDKVIKMCSHYGLRCQCIDKEMSTGSSKGHLARDTGISMADGKYIVLWDDDNIYYNNALSIMIEEINDYDMIVCKINYRVRRPSFEYLYEQMPKVWNNTFVKSDIDTMNVMLKTRIARKFKWTDSNDYSGDFHWLKAIEESGIRIKYSERIIGIKN